mgnify:CR=1 FL=1
MADKKTPIFDAVRILSDNLDHLAEQCRQAKATLHAEHYTLHEAAVLLSTTYAESLTYWAQSIFAGGVRLAKVIDSELAHYQADQEQAAAHYNEPTDTLEEIADRFQAMIKEQK